HTRGSPANLIFGRTSRMSKGYSFDIREVLPKIKFAGEKGAVLSEAGAAFLDPTGTFKAGVPLCPPEGDAGTGMVATNSVLPRTGNVSAGTSIFSMLVLEKPLGGVYPEIDVVATPDGKPVAMVHCNNCCSELDAWVRLFSEFAALSGKELSKGEVYELLYKNALNGDPDCGGTVAYNFLSGEPVAGVAEGRPMYFRTPDGSFNLANFIRAELYAAFGALKMGMDILAEKENVPADKFTGHGGLFKVQGVAQQFLADALNADVSVMKTAGEGGAWGMALLAAYMQCAGGKTLPEWLESCVFGGMERATQSPNPAGVSGFAEYIRRFKNGLAAQNAACR
ncbi:MAG: FGGY-family carbohydrate kinase, partial [Oscillospiraceae bacterium]